MDRVGHDGLAQHRLLQNSADPDLLTGRGGGEPTIADLLGHWHGDMERGQVRGIGYVGAARGNGALMPTRRTATVTNRTQTGMWPELDLLRSTFERGGVAQLETSRGCTNFFSFCPRGHKGQWAGAAPDALPWVLSEIREVFDLFPNVSRTLYLVDEEFIGRGAARMRCRERWRWRTPCTRRGSPGRPRVGWIR